MKTLCSIITIILWGLLLFFQHIACFDIFSLNLLRFYILAVLAAILQHTLLYFVHKKHPIKWALLICGIIYGVLAALKLHQLLTAHNYEPYPLGLPIWCIALDAAGAFITLKAFLGCSRQQSS